MVCFFPREVEESKERKKMFFLIFDRLNA